MNETSVFIKMLIFSMTDSSTEMASQTPPEKFEYIGKIYRLWQMLENRFILIEFKAN